MPKAKTKYPEIKDIKKDAQSLKENITSLKDHAVEDIKTNGTEKFEEIKDNISERAHTLSEQSQDKIKKAEARVREKPLQSMAIAFVAGLAVSALMGRR